MHKNITIGSTTAYHSFPDDGEQHPGLVLIEEIWGVTDHLRSVADRFVAAGYSVLAPELLPEGMLAQMTPQMPLDLFNPETRNEVQPKLREAMSPVMQPEFAEGAIAALKEAVDYLMADEGVNGNVAVLGFCFGGTYAFHLAAHDDRLRAAVPFYGHPPREDEIPNISCPILAFYGDQDQALMDTLPQLTERMTAAGKEFIPVVYPNVGHAFFNDTNPFAYDAAAAADAWEQALSFLAERMR